MLKSGRKCSAAYRSLPNRIGKFVYAMRKNQIFTCMEVSTIKLYSRVEIPLRYP